ncbi:50S ribosomal protein L29 [Microgenomates group bacterium RIFCSPLOWO2_01_FULL_46_13]|nr:MAG: 50S ribosomal protein L29 [Microgenomates group bacterium RIFCSPHIGHO2_01_FULL_45_11]OGV95111.1 MAG: 50S ribosomal protein L29 [Microgenomates group bacterium RIFCSPLOWO2_01_FULL_46_13]
MKRSKIAGLTIQELNQKLEKLSQEVVTARLEERQGKVKDVKRVFRLRKEVARLLTLLTQKKWETEATEKKVKEQ